MTSRRALLRGAALGVVGIGASLYSSGASAGAGEGSDGLNGLPSSQQMMSWIPEIVAPALRVKRTSPVTAREHCRHRRPLLAAGQLSLDSPQQLHAEARQRARSQVERALRGHKCADVRPAGAILAGVGPWLGVPDELPAACRGPGSR